MFAHNEQCLPYPEAIQQRVQQQQQVRQQQHFHVVNITHVQPRPAPQDLMDIHNNKEAAATAAANPTIDIAKLLHDVVHLDKQQQQLLYMSKEMIHASLVGTGLPEQKVVVDDLEGDALRRFAVVLLLLLLLAVEVADDQSLAVAVELALEDRAGRCARDLLGKLVALVAPRGPHGPVT